VCAFAPLTWLAHVSRAEQLAKPPTKDAARQFAPNFVKLPELSQH
jgi:hypothetical protein